MNEAAHFARFKKARKQRMLVAHKIDQSPLTAQNGHDGKRKLHDSLHLPEQLPWPMRAREWFRHTFGQGWEYVVVNKSVDSVTMPKWIASSILGTVLLFGVSSWWRASDQRDMLTQHY